MLTNFGEAEKNERTNTKSTIEWNGEIKMSVIPKWSRKKVQFQFFDMKTTWQKYLFNEKLQNRTKYKWKNRKKNMHTR